MTENATTWPTAELLLQPLPTSTDVVVIGGGLAGTALAYYLASEGVEVALVERADLNREASGTNAGSFHFQIALHQLTAWETDNVRDRLFAEVRLHAEAAAMWSTLESELDAALDVHINGGLMVAETPLELQILIDKQKIEQEAGLETHLLVGPELRAFAPYLADDLAGAVWCPKEGHANPLLAAPLFALRASERGAAVRTHAGVTAIESHPDGGAHRFTVTTTRGHIAAHRVVNAAGAWANDIAELSGLRFPIRADGLHLNVTEPREKVLEPMVQHIGRRLTLKQSTNNTFIIGGGWPAHPEPAPARYSTLWESAAGNTAVAVRVMPSLADVKVVRTWSGVMAFTDDLSPIVGETARLPGYHALIATTGFTLGPLMARLLAEHMSAPTPHSLPPAFAVDRGATSPTT
jgi:sarcosine oxidase, subunit beta